MPDWKEMRSAKARLVDKTKGAHAAGRPADTLADPLYDPLVGLEERRRYEQEEELAALGSGRAGPGSRSADPVRRDLRDMTEDPVFGTGDVRWAGLVRPEEEREAATKAERQAAWEEKKEAGVGPIARGLHKLDKRTGRLGADVTTRYAAKGMRAYADMARVGGVELPGYTGRGGANFFGRKDIAAKTSTATEKIGRRALGTGISLAAKATGEAPLVGPAVGVARDALLATREAGRAERADDIAMSADHDELTRSLALGSKDAHEKRRDESALKAGVRGVLAATLIPGLPSVGASAASVMKSGVDHVRSDARKTRLAAADGDDGALVRLGKDDQDYRKAMLEYLSVSTDDTGETRSAKAYRMARKSELEWGEDQGWASSGGSAPTDVRTVDVSEESESDSDSEVERPEILPPTADEIDDAVTVAEGEHVRLTGMKPSEELDHTARHGALLDDMKATFRPVAGRQQRMLPELRDGGHTLRPSLTAKRSRGEAARVRQKDRMGETLKDLVTLDESDWFDSRGRA